jgi:hypothetical protein
MKTFKFYSDAAHGWLAVKYQLLIDLGCAEEITSYSYQRGGTVYLEEDQDAGTFVRAYTARYGVAPVIAPSRWASRSRIRGYAPYRGARPFGAPITAQ